MHKLVYTVFKTIALSIIFIFLFDIVFYMYRVTSLNSRIESVSTSMRKVVMENNYLPSEIADTYSKIFKHMICDYNNVTYSDSMTPAQLVGGGNNVDGTNGNSINTAAFIAGMQWNYYTPATGVGLAVNATRQRWNGSSWTSTSVGNIVKTQMNTPAEYGDIMVVQINVDVFQPIWGWTQANGIYDNLAAGEQRDVTKWVRNASTTRLSYTYYVPCLNFRTITNS